MTDTNCCQFVMLALVAIISAAALEMDLNIIFKELGEGATGHELAKRDFRNNRDILLSRLDQIDVLFDSSDWTAKELDSYRFQLLSYLAEGRKLIGYRMKD